MNETKSDQKVQKANKTEATVPKDKEVDDVEDNAAGMGIAAELFSAGKQ